MNRILLDAKKLLLGIDEAESTPADFKEEINNSIKNNTITKAMAALLITARNNADALGKKIVKKQEDDVSGKGNRVSNKQVKEIIENENKQEKVKIERKKEEERDKKRKQESLRQAMQRIAEEDEKNQNDIRIQNKDI